MAQISSEGPVKGRRYPVMFVPGSKEGKVAPKIPKRQVNVKKTRALERLQKKPIKNGQSKTSLYNARS